MHLFKKARCFRVPHFTIFHQLFFISQVRLWYVWREKTGHPKPVSPSPGRKLNSHMLPSWTMRSNTMKRSPSFSPVLFISVNSEQNVKQTFSFSLRLGAGTVKLLIYTYQVSKCDSHGTKALYSLRLPRPRTYPFRLQQLQPQV